MELKEYVEYCRDFIKDNISKLEGNELPIEAVGYQVCQRIISNGTCTHSQDEAKRYILHWWGECGDYFDWIMVRNMVINPFKDPERFMAQMVFDGVLQLFNTVNDDNDEQEITITREFIAQVLGDIENKTIKF